MNNWNTDSAVARLHMRDLQREADQERLARLAVQDQNNRLDVDTEEQTEPRTLAHLLKARRVLR